MSWQGFTIIALKALGKSRQRTAESQVRMLRSQSLGDPKGREVYVPLLPSVQFLSFSCSFQEKFGQLIGWHLHFEENPWSPPLGNPGSTADTYCI